MPGQPIGPTLVVNTVLSLGPDVLVGSVLRLQKGTLYFIHKICIAEHRSHFRAVDPFLFRK